ncbi:MULTISPECIES: hypothetical protein [Thalassobellus]|uniref:hypothetical protein n=1 Tax=Thalassobellus TaxID=3400333 RepID=UPI00379BE97F
MAYLVLTFFGTYFIEILYRRIFLEEQLKKSFKKFEVNKEFIMNLEINNYKVGSGHIYE